MPRHVAFKVDDVRAVVEAVRREGWGTVGEIVERLECAPG
jgi:hypothetical protein